MFTIPKDLPQFETGQALLILDLQNEFLSAEGKLPMETDNGFVKNIKETVPAFREKGKVIWVRTEFEEARLANDTRGKGEAIVTDEQVEDRSQEGPSPPARSPKSARRRSLRTKAPKRASTDEPDEAFLSGSEAGRDSQCCLPGTAGAEFLDCISSVIDSAKDSVVIKSYYSAFMDTSLLSTLRSTIVTDLYICGSLSNVSVYATALDAARHGFSITLLEDCLGYRSKARHDEAMRQMTELMGADSMTSGELRRTLKTVKTEKNLEMGTLASVGDTSGRDVLQLLKSMRLNDADPAGDSVMKRPTRARENKAKQRRDEAQDPPVKTTSSPSSPQNASVASCKVKSRVRVRKREASEQTKNPGDVIAEGDCQVIHNFLPSSLAEDAFQKLQKEVQWQKMHHRGGEVPRLVAVQGEIGKDGSIPIYRHPADESPPLEPFSRTVSAIREQVQKRLQQPVNHVLIQCYRSGEDNISEHSDKTLDIVRGSSIVNVSLGAQRVMTLRTKKTFQSPKGMPRHIEEKDKEKEAKDDEEKNDETPSEENARQTQRVPLPHNSLFTLGPSTNLRWLHAIRPDRRPSTIKAPAETAFETQRISLTFRHIGTFIDPNKGVIWGQGAKAKSRKNARAIRDGNWKRNQDNGDQDRKKGTKEEERESERLEEEEEMVRAFGFENHDPGFEWDQSYGQGFDVLGVSPPPPLMPTVGDT